MHNHSLTHDKCHEFVAFPTAAILGEMKSHARLFTLYVTGEGPSPLEEVNSIGMYSHYSQTVASIAFEKPPSFLLRVEPAVVHHT